jgi:archaellum biogenesis ATPase FlaH
MPNTAIHIITLPNRMTDGKDITDYFVKYAGTPDELLFSLSDFSAGKKQFRPISFSELMKRNLGEVKWMVEQLIPAESIIALSGHPASFKTWLILHLAIQLTKGEKFFNQFATSVANVLIIDEESGTRLIKQRLEMLTNDLYLPIYFHSLENFKLSEESIAKIIAFCKEQDIKVVIFDSLVRIHTANENEAGAMASVVDFLKRLTKEGLTVIFTHHHRKQSTKDAAFDMRGSSDILASVDCHLAVKKKNHILTVQQTKLRYAEESKPFKVSVNQEGCFLKFAFLEFISKEKDKVDDVKDLALKIIAESDKPIFQKKILEKMREIGTQCGDTTLKNALRELVDEEEVYTQKGEKNKIYYSLEPINEEEEQGKIALP